jgi:hypothetical protein
VWFRDRYSFAPSVTAAAEDCVTNSIVWLAFLDGAKWDDASETMVDKKKRPQHTPSPGAAKDACTLERLVIFFKSMLHWQYVTRSHTF